jgi:dienelactone hydrolase
VRTRFEKMPLDAKVVFDAAANVAGLFFTPVAQPAAEWVPPDYVQRDAFDDKPITIESGGYHLSGFISMPKSPGQHPGVVLVHGSGPHDADETVGGNKPFRDLAWGLASRGIAVIRYVKRTAVMSQKPDVNLTGLTVREETVDDARVALSVLARTAGVDSNRAFVVGHSLGANLAPRIAAGDRRVVGLVLMAGSVRPLEDVALEQVRFLANRDSTVDEREKKQIEAMQKAAQTIKSPALRDTTIVDFLGAPIPGSYWLDLRSYRPGEAAARAGVPILVLRGERDYQVAATDFEAWKKALAGVPGVTFKSYPGLNHLFVAGTGAPNPEEYMKPGHVAPEVVADLAAWIADPRGARLSGGDQRNKRIK